MSANPNTPISVLEQLVLDHDEGVRKSVASNPNAPADILEILFAEPLTQERDASQILQALKSSTQLAQLRADFLKKLCAGLKPSFARVYGLLLPDCPPAVLTKCSKSALWLERCAVAQNSVTPVKLLQVLEKDSDARVRGAAQR